MYATNRRETACQSVIGDWTSLIVHRGDKDSFRMSVWPDSAFFMGGLNDKGTKRPGGGSDLHSWSSSCRGGEKCYQPGWHCRQYLSLTTLISDRYQNSRPARAMTLSMVKSESPRTCWSLLMPAA